MNYVIISTYSTPTQLQNYINKRLEPLYSKSYRPTNHIKIQNKVTFITYFFPTQLSKANYVTLIAKGIRDYIYQEFTSKYMTDIIRNHDGFLTEEANRMILLPYNIEEEDEIDELTNTIKTEILEKNSLCVDGWMKFRLGGYKTYIRRKVERIVFEQLAHQEYEEFIELLKQFIQTQQSLMSFLHIMPKADGSICLYDKRYKEIPKIGLREYALVGQTDQSCKEEMVLSTLLTISPLKMKIHKKEMYKNERLIQTIQMIYEDKVSLCKSCKNCEAASDILTQKKQ